MLECGGRRFDTPHALQQAARVEKFCSNLGPDWTFEECGLCGMLVEVGAGSGKHDGGGELLRSAWRESCGGFVGRGVL
jgi:hypothetical protein